MDTSGIGFPDCRRTSLIEFISFSRVCLNNFKSKDAHMQEEAQTRHQEVIQQIFSDTVPVLDTLFINLLELKDIYLSPKAESKYRLFLEFVANPQALPFRPAPPQK
ncbi:MAG TPA: hypothetical protein VG941_00705 [Candidatus Paceibacterota bacterium]|nr:hypothetical protein [Candidatus Paceibacterota bacterium]